MASKVLSQDQRKVLELFIDNFSLSESAKVLGVKTATVCGWARGKEGAFAEAYGIAKWAVVDKIEAVLIKRALGLWQDEDDFKPPSDYAANKMLDRYSPNENSYLGASNSIPTFNIVLEASGECPEVIKDEQ